MFLVHKANPMLLKFLGPTVASMLFIAVQELDKDLKGPWSTIISIFIAAWIMSARFTKLINRVESVEKEFKEFRDERREDSEKMRNQIRTTSLIDPPTGKILIVDDDEYDVTLLRRRLEPNFIVDSCGTLAEATAKLKDHSFDCVLLDLKLPDSRPNRTVSDFLNQNPKTACIVLTGVGDDHIHKMCIDQGASDVWVKGVNDTDLFLMTRKLKEAVWNVRTNQP